PSDCQSGRCGCNGAPPPTVCLPSAAYPTTCAGQPNAPCGAGDNNGPNNGTCGTDGRVYYCYQTQWHLKEDCVAENKSCIVQPAGVADTCGSSTIPGEQPPSAPCGAGDNNGPDNGMCGPDGRVYYCYQGVWRLKDDCAGRHAACIVEPAGVADK